MVKSVQNIGVRVLKFAGSLKSFLVIAIIVILWHYMSFKLVNFRKSSFFYKEENCFDKISFFKKEKFYENIFKIKHWKDKIPQYVAKNGFSKKKIENFDLDYLKRFISETYRAEVNHFICCLIIPFLFFCKYIMISTIVSVLIILGNVPCILIQRYNRLRIRRIILKIRKKRGII